MENLKLLINLKKFGYNSEIENASSHLVLVVLNLINKLIEANNRLITKTVISFYIYIFKKIHYTTYYRSDISGNTQFSITLEETNPSRAVEEIILKVNIEE